MKAMLENDRCFSTVKGHLAQTFNTDGIARDHIDIEEARTAFNFDIEKHPAYTEDGRPIPRLWHLRRTDDDSIIPCRGLGDEFRPVQHRQVFDYIVKDIMPQVPEMKLETVGTLHGGATGMVMAKFGDSFHVSGDKSRHENRLFFFNPNGRSSLVVGFTTVRLFCQNQIAAATNSAKHDGIRIWHTTNADIRCDNAVKVIYDAVGAVQHLHWREEQLANTPAGMKELTDLLDRLLPLARFEEGTRGWTRTENQRKEIIRQFTDGETAQSIEGDNAWKLLNAFTYPIFNPISIGKETDIAQLTYAGMNGCRADRVTNIMTEVEKEVGLAA